MAENGNSERKLSTNQRRAIEALLVEPTVKRAAEKAGLGERTVHRYLADDAFKARLRQHQDEAITAAVAALVGLTGEAIDTLRSLLQDKETPPSVRARAALGILAERRKAAELDDLAQRVARLEEELEGEK